MITYNEFLPSAADWLGNLVTAGEIPAGTIDRRSIKELKGADCFAATHFFAGIGGWPLALRLAGWPDELPVWTGSCPCQPFSAAGKRRGKADDRHLWPEMFRLIDECRPAIVFGEQVASKDGLGWLDGVFADLEGAGYTCGAADLCAASVGAPHIRQRLYWVAIANGVRHNGWQDSARAGEPKRHLEVETSPERSRLADTDGERFRAPRASRGNRQDAKQHGDAGRLANTGCERDERWRRTGIISAAANDLKGETQERQRGGNAVGDSFAIGGLGNSTSRGTGLDIPRAKRVQHSLGAWDDGRTILCQDGKTRRVGRGVQPLAYGVPRSLGQSKPELRSLLRPASGNRNSRLHGYGNAIVPQVAAVFIQTVMEWLNHGNPLQGLRANDSAAGFSR